MTPRIAAVVQDEPVADLRQSAQNDAASSDHMALLNRPGRHGGLFASESRPVHA